MAEDDSIPAALPRSPAPGRVWLKLTEAAEREGVSRKVMQGRLRRDPSAGWVDTTGQRARWYVYADALGTAPGSGPVIAALTERVGQLSAEVAELRARDAAREVADLRAALVRAETVTTLLMEAFELQEAAGARFRQALSLHNTPGHAGELLDGPRGTSGTANQPAPQ